MEVVEKVGIPEIYKFYKETLIYKGKRYRSKIMIFKDQHRFIIDQRKFSNILKDFNLELARLLVEENLEFLMPANLGRVRLRKYKRHIRLNEDGTVDLRNQVVDWKATKDLWKKEYPGLNSIELKKIKGKPLVFHLNEHSENYVVRLFWNKKNCAIINRQVYSLILTRTNKRRIAALIKHDPNTNYYE